MQFLDQIADWIRSCACPFVRSHAMLIVGIWAAVAATFSACWARKALRPKAKPGVVEVTLTLPIQSPAGGFKGSAIVANDGPRRCIIEYIQLTHSEFKFEMMFVSFDRNLAHRDMIEAKGNELPLPLVGYEKVQIFFRGRRNPNVAYEGGPPDTLTLVVKFDSLKDPARVALVPAGGTGHYKYISVRS